MFYIPWEENDHGGGSMTRVYRWPLKTEHSSWAIVCKKMRASVLKPQGVKFCQYSVRL